MSIDKEIIWPALPLAEWADTCATLHMWMQIVGKIELAQTPLVNHWWNTTLYVTSRGLTTFPMPYQERTFQMDFDFIDHTLSIKCSDGSGRTIALRSRSVAEFYSEVMSALGELGITIKIWTLPSEVPDPIPFEQDRTHASYDPDYANRFWRILVQVDRLFKEFRARFIGKVSPVHFFWGGLDMAVTRFSGRKAPEREGADSITREGYSHEVISHGFWPGGGAIKDAAFYAYSAPEPAGFSEASIKPAEAFYSQDTKGFVLFYDEVRNAASPDEMVMEFLQSTYDAGATLAKWDRSALER